MKPEDSSEPAIQVSPNTSTLRNLEVYVMVQKRLKSSIAHSLERIAKDLPAFPVERNLSSNTNCEASPGIRVQNQAGDGVQGRQSPAGWGPFAP